MIHYYKYYIFINELNETIKKNIKKLKNINVILNFKIINNTFINKATEIIKFCRKNKIPFYLVDNVNIAKKIGANGIYISSNNKKINICVNKHPKFNLIGSAHNQMEYFIKYQQGCETIMLSPIFYNIKYSINKILRPVRFNLIAKNWKGNLCALGGLTVRNIKKVQITKAKSVGFKSFITKEK